MRTGSKRHLDLMVGSTRYESLAKTAAFTAANVRLNHPFRESAERVPNLGCIRRQFLPQRYSKEQRSSVALRLCPVPRVNQVTPGFEEHRFEV